MASKLMAILQAGLSSAIGLSIVFFVAYQAIVIAIAGPLFAVAGFFLEDTLGSQPHFLDITFKACVIAPIFGALAVTFLVLIAERDEQIRNHLQNLLYQVADFLIFPFVFAILYTLPLFVATLVAILSIRTYVYSSANTGDLSGLQIFYLEFLLIYVGIYLRRTFNFLKNRRHSRPTTIRASIQ